MTNVANRPWVLMNGDEPCVFPAPSGGNGVLVFSTPEEAKKYQRRVKPAKKHRRKVVTVHELFALKRKAGAEFLARTDCRGSYHFTPA